MQFYKNIVVGLKKVFDELVEKDLSVAHEMAYSFINTKSEGFLKTAKVADDAKADAKHAVSKNNNDLLGFFTFISVLQGINNESVKQKVFDYLSVNGFPGLNISPEKRKDFLVSLLEAFLKQAEVTINQIKDWIKNCDKNLISILNKEFARILLEPKAHNKPIAEVRKCLLEFANNKNINEEQLVNWLKVNDKEGLAGYINNRLQIFPAPQLLELLTVLINHKEILNISIDGKKLLLQRMLSFKNQGLPAVVIEDWFKLNDTQGQLASVYDHSLPKPRPY